MAFDGGTPPHRGLENNHGLLLNEMICDWTMGQGWGMVQLLMNVTDTTPSKECAPLAGQQGTGYPINN